MSLVGERPEWHARAACRGQTELFFPTRGEQQTEALKYCAICPVWRDCLDHALANGERNGIWGGVSEKERRRLRRKRAAARRAAVEPSEPSEPTWAEQQRERVEGAS